MREREGSAGLCATTRKGCKFSGEPMRTKRVFEVRLGAVFVDPVARPAKAALCYRAECCAPRGPLLPRLRGPAPEGPGSCQLVATTAPQSENQNWARLLAGRVPR